MRRIYVVWQYHQNITIYAVFTSNIVALEIFKRSLRLSHYRYYNGEKQAPVLTIFIGGNHEASNYLQELPYGGWVAPNIYYLGYAGVVNVAGNYITFI